MLCVVSALVLMSVNSNTAKPLGGFFSVPIEDNGTSSLLGEREVRRGAFYVPQRAVLSLPRGETCRAGVAERMKFRDRVVRQRRMRRHLLESPPPSHLIPLLGLDADARDRKPGREACVARGMYWDHARGARGPARGIRGATCAEKKRGRFIR
jgi:hypothetical protein